MEEVSVRAALNNIMDCFTGADGGIKFATVKFAFEDLDKQAKNGNFPAYELVEILLRFSKLIDVLAQRR